MLDFLYISRRVGLVVSAWWDWEVGEEVRPEEGSSADVSYLSTHTGGGVTKAASIGYSPKVPAIPL